MLPIMTTSEDVLQIINYLKTKPTGISLVEAKEVLGSKCLDKRKLYAYKYWGFIEDDAFRLNLSERGRKIIRNPDDKEKVFGEVLNSIKPYGSLLDWIFYQGSDELINLDVIAKWEANHREVISDIDRTLTDQAACFFRLCEGAGLGKLIIGRKGQPTRLVINKEKLEEFCKGESVAETGIFSSSEIGKVSNGNDGEDEKSCDDIPNSQAKTKLTNKRVYLTHGKNKSFLDTIQKLLSYGEMEPVISIKSESVAKPVPDKVLDDMRSCGAAIIHVEDESKVFNVEGEDIVILNPNVLIEIGAAMALYGHRFILLVKEGVELPSNLQGLYEVRYTGDSLDADTTIRLLEAIKKLKEEKLPGE